jgi:hypothetical protein
MPRNEMVSLFVFSAKVFLCPIVDQVKRIPILRKDIKQKFPLYQEEKLTLGKLASLKVVFDRPNGDTDNGKRYMVFGTYGHKTVTSNDNDQS